MRKPGRGRQTVARAAAVVMVVTVLSKLLGFGREASLAAVFGATRVTDAYLVAMVIPGLLFSVVMSAITTVGIPVFSEYLHQEEKRKSFLPLVWSCFHIIVFFLLIVCVAAFPLTPWLVKLLAPGFGPEQAALAATLVKIVLPAIVFMGLAGWAQGVVCFEVFRTLKRALRNCSHNSLSSESVCSKLKPVVVCPSEKCCYPKIFGIVPRRKS
ncbi:MAG TPA: hypothetical protein DCE07_05325 [Peptococcaceae bacterium]|nr:hypothetical protein [Peptococcaceae bacterium]